MDVDAVVEKLQLSGPVGLCYHQSVQNKKHGEGPERHGGIGLFGKRDHTMNFTHKDRNYLPQMINN